MPVLVLAPLLYRWIQVTSFPQGRASSLPPRKHLSKLYRTFFRACPSERFLHTRVHESCNKHFTVVMFVMLSTKWVTRGFGLNMRRRLCVAHVAQVPHTFPVSAHVCRRLGKLRHLASLRLTCMKHPFSSDLCRHIENYSYMLQISSASSLPSCITEQACSIMQQHACAHKLAESTTRKAYTIDPSRCHGPGVVPCQE